MPEQSDDRADGAVPGQADRTPAAPTDRLDGRSAHGQPDRQSAHDRLDRQSAHDRLDRQSAHDRLDRRLAHGRLDLLDRIEQPPLTRIRARAATRRHRHRAALAAGVFAVLGGSLLVAAPWDGESPDPIAAERSPTAPEYAGAGLTVTGLAGTTGMELAGTISRVEFVDPATGFLLTTCPATDPCPAELARTSDGGRSWTIVPLSAGVAALPDLGLLSYPGGPVALVDGTGRAWWRADGDPLAEPVRLRAGTADPPCRLRVSRWRAGESPPPGVSQPGIEVCWVAPAPAADGRWWIGGVRDGRPTVAVTDDLGATWQAVPLTVPAATPAGPGTSVEVATLGSHLYAMVLGPDRALRAVLHSVDGGRSFTRTGGGTPAAVSGTLVPLLDGRLLVVGTDRRWYLSADDGASFQPADGNLPMAGRLARTSVGYVAYDLFGAGWAAYSPDGSSWRKLPVR